MSQNNVNQIESFSIQEGPISTELFLVHDAAGNLTDDGQGKTFEWDAANRLRAINYGSQRSEFTYDGLSRRVKIVEKNGGSVTSTKNFVWIGTGIAQERDASNAITRRYFAEGEQRAVAGTKGLQKYFYTRDHLGSIRELTNNAGALQTRYEYDPYGKRTKLSGTLDVDFGYTGHYHHAPSGLNLTLYRAYNPALGRWLSRDPIGEMGPDGPNLYGYVRSNPTNLVDPLGEWGIAFGTMGGRYFNIGWGDPTFLFTPQSARDALQGAEAFVDGVTLFADPFADNGFYDKCDDGLSISRDIGEWARDIELSLAGSGILANSSWFANSSLFGRTGTLFGKSSGLLNNKDIARIGWGYKQGIGEVFRAVVGGRKTSIGRTISKIPAYFRHLDF